MSERASGGGPAPWARRLALLGVLALAAVYHAAYFRACGPVSRGEPDAIEYQHIARTLVTEGRYLSGGQDVPLARYALRTPGYPGFLAGLFALGERTGDRHRWVRPAQALLDLGVVMLAYGIGTAAAGPVVGLIAALLAAIYPPFLRSASQTLTETLSTFLLTGATYLLVRAVRSSRLPWYAAAGLVGGLTALVRPAFAYLPVLALPVAVGWAWQACARRGAAVRERAGWRVGLAWVVFSAVFLSALAPWLIRNWVVFGRPVGLSSQRGFNFWHGNMIAYWGMKRAGYEKLVRAEVGASARDEMEVDAILMRAGWRTIGRQIRQTPRAYLRLLVMKFRRVWEVYQTPWSPAMGWSGWLVLDRLHGVLLFLALIGMGSAVLTHRAGLAIIFVIGYGTLVHVVGFAVPGRFNVPMMPGVLVLAAMGIEFLFPRLRPQR